MNLAFSKKQFRFRFENTWLKEANFKKEVSSFWEGLPAIHLLPNLISVSSFMSKWGRNFFHKFRDKIKRQKSVVDSLVNCYDEESVRRYFEEKNKLDDLMVHEEDY